MERYVYHEKKNWIIDKRVKDRRASHTTLTSGTYNSENSVYKPELYFMDSDLDIFIHYFFDSIQERKKFIDQNPSWRDKFSLAYRPWDKKSFAIDDRVKTYVSNLGQVDYYATAYRPGYAYFPNFDGIGFKEKRKTKLPTSWMGHILYEPKRHDDIKE